MLRLERHPLGPRVYLLGTRVHEWHLGAALLLGLAVGGLLDRVDDSFTTVATITGGLWLIAKDWRDVFPAQRDSAAWRLGLHARVHPLRAVRRADPLPKLAAVTAAWRASSTSPRPSRRTSPGGTTLSSTSSRSRR